VGKRLFQHADRGGVLCSCCFATAKANAKGYKVYGEKGLAMAAQRELARIRHMKNKPKDKLPDERFFSIFSSKTAMNNAPFFLKTPSLYCCIKYDSQWVPEIFFVDPVQIRGMRDKNGGSKQ
jgi:hypothetical protein